MYVAGQRHEYLSAIDAAAAGLCLEALQNTVKYAHATQARITLQAANGTLDFRVSDDGTGYDARHTPMGSGLRNMADRLAALGGRLEIQSGPGQGTTITGHLPTPAASGNVQGTAVTDERSRHQAAGRSAGANTHLSTPRQTLIAGHDATE